jgi:hypothetical protein
VRAAWKKLYGAVEDELHGMMTLPGGGEVGFDSSSVLGFARRWSSRSTARTASAGLNDALSWTCGSSAGG